jgi:hypothetical protein
MSSETTPSQADRPLESARPRRRRWVGPVTGAIVLAVVLGFWAASRGGPAQTATGSPAAPGPVTANTAPGGSYTLLDGTRTDLAALRGRATMVWFVANGCASCAVSIPAVASHLASFTRADTRILVLGMYGAFGQGASGRQALTSFGTAAAGSAFANPTWTWGLASEQLTSAYDSAGVPDAYYFLDAAGHIVYENSVPVSTMGALLAHLRTSSGHTAASQQNVGAPSRQGPLGPAPLVALP